MTMPAILFVDDEPIIRRLSVRLIAVKYPVIEADSVDQALVALRAPEQEVGVVITDMSMQGKDGMALIDEIAVHFVGISVIASSGDLTRYSCAALIDQGKIFAALEKPWDKARALRVIDAAMLSFRQSRGDSEHRN